MAQLVTTTLGVYVHMCSWCICYWEHCVWFSCWEYSLPGLVTLGSAVRPHCRAAALRWQFATAINDL